MKRVVKDLSPVNINLVKIATVARINCCEEPDKVYLENRWFNEILNRTYSWLNYFPWKRPVVKIQVKKMERRDQLSDSLLPGIPGV